MTSPEPRDEPSLRPPQDPAPPAEPDAPKAADQPPGSPGNEPPKRATPFGEPVDPYHVDPGEVHPSPPEEPPRAPVRTEQMQRNAEYAQRQHAEEAPKPGPKDTGKYKGQVPPLSMPTDPLRPYASGFSKRKRRPEWPVLIFALVVVAVVAVGCCLAGFALFSVWHPFAH